MPIDQVVLLGGVSGYMVSQLPNNWKDQDKWADLMVCFPGSWAYVISTQGGYSIATGRYGVPLTSNGGVVAGHRLTCGAAGVSHLRWLNSIQSPAIFIMVANNLRLFISTFEYADWVNITAGISFSSNYHLALPRQGFLLTFTFLFGLERDPT